MSLPPSDIKHPHFIRASYFIWMIIPAGLIAAYFAFGLPHGIWSYEFRDNGDPYNPYAARRYTACTYWGPYGWRSVPARNARCPWVRFFKEEL